MRWRLCLLSITIILLLLVSCSQSDIDTTLSSTGELSIVNSVFKKDFVWNVTLTEPFKINSEKIVALSNNHKTILEDGQFHNIYHEFTCMCIRDTGITVEVNMVPSGEYHIYITYFELMPSSDLVVSDTTPLLSDKIDEWLYRSIFVSNVRISPDSISIIDIDSLIDVYRSESNFDIEYDFSQNFMFYQEWDGSIYKSD